MGVGGWVARGLGQRPPPKGQAWLRQRIQRPERASRRGLLSTAPLDRCRRLRLRGSLGRSKGVSSARRALLPMGEAFTARALGSKAAAGVRGGCLWVGGWVGRSGAWERGSPKP